MQDKPTHHKLKPTRRNRQQDYQPTWAPRKLDRLRQEQKETAILGSIAYAEKEHLLYRLQLIPSSRRNQFSKWLINNQQDSSPLPIPVHLLARSGCLPVSLLFLRSVTAKYFSMLRGRFFPSKA
ncbi:hypothetical protein PgNI_10548 [Pyricularia grisea]|uniref:Uncharacterized protein n=1 Tax=Pyricularia grisea TaxID=148305 RepID=A0A6P8AYY5_PYRGI|nr:hypothetical protein PgNI_10548 [Pyricularia grisea]TLD07550.1 hypothetical protein PgNI_10548 [Pyricularia grisea]